MKMARTLTAFLLVAALSLMSQAVAQAQSIEIMPGGSRSASKGAAQTFTGPVSVTPLFGMKDQTRITAGRVTFEPGARSAWHTHPAGQILIITEGTGWVQQWDSKKSEMKAGDVVSIPPGVKHWHGATKTDAMTHIAIQEMVNGHNVDWMEAVSDEQFGGS
jgi:quercetin dioxygenase-like cupin family protein